MENIDDILGSIALKVHESQKPTLTPDEIYEIMRQIRNEHERPVQPFPAPGHSDFPQHSEVQVTELLLKETGL